MTKTKIQIKSIFGNVLFEHETENNTIKKTVEEAVKQSADLRSADLRSADLESANLESADLRSANLRSANLRFADLESANLESANLRFADLRFADLESANLRFANLQSADLRFADLQSADLRSADLRSADLRFADLESTNLESIRNDYWDVLFRAIPEIPNLIKSIKDGKIDGSTYEGECACLCGTLEKTTDNTIKKIIYDRRNPARPIERFFSAIKKGDTPETNQVSKIVLDWAEEFYSFVKPQTT